MNVMKQRHFLRIFFFIGGVLAAWYLYESLYRRNIWFFGVAALGILLGVLFLLTWSKKDEINLNLPYPKKTSTLWTLFFNLMVVYAAAVYFIPLGLFISGSGRLLIGYLLAGIGSWLLYAVDEKQSPFLSLSMLLLILGVTYRSIDFIGEIQAGPFALGWSEGSRFYNASTFLAQRVYGQALPLPVLHPSRYLMQALPFVFGIKSILFHRVWQVLLWLVTTWLTAWLFSKRLKVRSRFPMVVFSAFFFLFLFQGAVYYHLLVCVILVLVGYKKDQPLRTLIFVLLASFWAGISRVNWIPVPAMLAIALYLLDTPLKGRDCFKYLIRPIVWFVAGSVLAFLTKQGYMAISGEPRELFDSAFSSSLLWYRLLPNATFFLGILPAIFLVCLPMGALFLRSWQQGLKKELHWLRWLGLFGMLAVLFAGGILVSLKIGGGGDLHNMDAFLCLWALVLPSLIEGAYQPEDDQDIEVKTAQHSPAWILLMFLIPVIFAFMRARTINFAPASAQDNDLRELRHALETIKDEPGDILFISERQLLTFGDLKEIPMVAEYEKVFLMEMAMGNNQPYLQEFARLLENHQYKAIVSDPVNTAFQTPDHGFAEENNAWVGKVLLPMLEQYTPVLSWRNGEVNLLVPNNQSELIEALEEPQK